MLLDEILKRRSLEIKADHQQREIQAVEQGERAQLSLLEEKVKEVLTMLRSLNSMVKSIFFKMDILYAVLLCLFEKI